MSREAIAKIPITDSTLCGVFAVVNAVFVLLHWSVTNQDLPFRVLDFHHHAARLDVFGLRQLAVGDEVLLVLVFDVRISAVLQVNDLVVDAKRVALDSITIRIQNLLEHLVERLSGHW